MNMGSIGTIKEVIEFSNQTLSQNINLTTG